MKKISIDHNGYLSYNDTFMDIMEIISYEKK